MSDKKLEMVAVELTKLIVEVRKNDTALMVQFTKDPKKFILETYLDCLKVVTHQVIEPS